MEEIVFVTGAHALFLLRLLVARATAARQRPSISSDSCNSNARPTLTIAR
jgi:hypothetical protein